MLNDEKMIEVVSEYGGTVTNFDCILYACVEGGLKNVNPMLFGSAILIGGGIAGVAGALSNDFVILTLENNTISLYVLNALATKINDKVGIPLQQVLKIKKGKFLVWNTVKIYFREKSKVKFTISNKVMGIKKQKANVDTFLHLLDNFK